MLRSFFIAAFIIVLISCNKPTGIKDYVEGSDSVAINFFKGDGTMDMVVKVSIIKDKKQLETLAGYMESTAIEDTRCGYDGSIHFFKGGVVLKDINFRMNNPKCMHFSFVLDKSMYSTKLSGEAKEFLTQIMKH